jgi:S1-C subfamily serine protease
VKRRVHIIAAALVAVAVAASVAFARSDAKPTGTGVVVIDTNLAYQGGEAAGTGMVLNSSGEILTNNHVIRGATAIKIVVPATGKRYTAKVVGYDPSADLAVLQAVGASNLKTVTLGNSAKLKVGLRVTAVGNAGGTGKLTSSSGKIVATSRSITVSDDQGGSERLTRLIETNASVQPGDSGGPLENTQGKVIGIDTAAAIGYGFQQTAAGNGYAIPINRALAVVKQIVNGASSTTVHVGDTAFLGVSLGPAQAYGPFGYAAAGALVEGVLPGGAADTAGLTAGDVITGIDGHTVASPDVVAPLLLTKHPGDQVSVSYTDQAGASHTATITLASGPPQ